MKVENMKDLSIIIELIKSRNSIAEEGLSNSLHGGIKNLDKIIFSGLVKLTCNLSNYTGRLMKDYDRNLTDDVGNVNFEKEIKGLEHSLQSLYMLIDKKIVNIGDKIVDEVVLDLWRSSWIITSRFLNESGCTREEIEKLLKEAHLKNTKKE